MSTLLLALLAASVSSDAPETIFAASPAIFDCAPKKVGPQQRITFTKRVEELDELAVMTPRGEVSHFLVVGAPPEEMRPLMTTEALARANTFSVEVSSLQGLEWAEAAMPEKIFQEPGRYEFFISSTLESEEGGYTCTVEYSP
jgi:hypothetical protein